MGRMPTAVMGFGPRAYRDDILFPIAWPDFWRSAGMRSRAISRALVPMVLSVVGFLWIVVPERHHEVLLSLSVR